MWLSRDKDGYFILFGEKPVRNVYRDGWVQESSSDDLVRIGFHLEGFEDMSWDDEPMEVYITVHKKIENEVPHKKYEHKRFDKMYEEDMHRQILKSNYTDTINDVLDIKNILP